MDDQGQDVHAYIYTHTTNSSGATTYLWSVTGGASIAPQGSSANVNFNSALSGTASVKVSTGNACGFSAARTLAVSVNLACRTAGEPLELGSMTLYPNPARDRVQLRFSATGAMEYRFLITDLLGKQVAVFRLNAQEGRNEFEIDLSGLDRGLYQCALMTQDGTPSIQRIVIE